MTPEERKQLDAHRKSRNLALGAVLFAFVVLFYIITFVKMST